MASKFLKALGARIRELRKSDGRTQDAFAQSVGLDRAFYGRVERGSQNIAMITAARIAATLDMPISDLTAGLPPYDASTDEVEAP
ncbi:helix-turn-helix transcriptional regulator [Sphingomonas sp. UYP23]